MVQCEDHEYNIMSFESLDKREMICCVGTWVYFIEMDTWVAKGLFFKVFDVMQQEFRRKFNNHRTYRF